MNFSHEKLDEPPVQFKASSQTQNVPIPIYMTENVDRPQSSVKNLNTTAPLIGAVSSNKYEGEIGRTGQVLQYGFQRENSPYDEYKIKPRTAGISLAGHLDAKVGDSKSLFGSNLSGISIPTFGASSSAGKSKLDSRSDASKTTTDTIFLSNVSPLIGSNITFPTPIFGKRNEDVNVSPLTNPSSSSITHGFVSSRPTSEEGGKKLLDFGAKREETNKPELLFGTNNDFQKSLFGGKSKEVIKSMPVPDFKVEQGQGKKIGRQEFSIFKPVRVTTPPQSIFGSHSNSESTNIFSDPTQKIVSTVGKSLGPYFKARQKEKATEFEENLKLSHLAEKAEPTVLIAVDIDQKCLNRAILLSHFSKFGKVNKVLMNKKSNQASIYFKDHKSAAEAKQKGKRLHPMIPEIKLFYAVSPNQETRPIISYGDIEEFPYSKPAMTFKPKPPPVRPKPGEIFAHPLVVSTESLPSTSEIKPQNSKLSEDHSGTVILRKSNLRRKAPTGNIGKIKDKEVLIKQQANNNYDRFLILDARDKLLRTKQQKIHDVRKAHYLAATCPDMCPEKERYSRDIQYDLSIYEMTDGILNHKLCVKKFSRSSADKHEPLPHELRPGPVLKLTMDYLVCNIIDRQENYSSQLDVWYNYLCNRTRGLRNDIMTQHLVEENAVYVLENITRFHIHCSHHLCEEPPDLFDSKMNAEHLTKSLQSLKESYYDMGQKNIFFDSEPEFRTYEILLDASDGNVIFKYLNFREFVRNAEDVQFSIKVVRAIQTNNFISFFKLLHKATYLQACLMHQHFLSVRIKALQVIMKAYHIPKESQAIQSSVIMNKLRFSDESKFRNFIRHFGLTVDEDSKMHFTNATVDLANRPSLQKCVDFIESKKNYSTGIIVHGGPLPRNPLEYYKPNDSFDSIGYMKREAYFSIIHSTKKLENESVGISKPLSEDQGYKIADLEKVLLNKIELMRKMTLSRKFFSKWKYYVDLQKKKQLAIKQKQILLLRKVTKRWLEFARVKARQNKIVKLHIISKFFQRWMAFTASKRENRLVLEKVNLLLSKIMSRNVVNIWKSFVEKQKMSKAIHSLRTKIIVRKFFINWRIKTILSDLEKRVDVYYKVKLLKTCLIKWKEWLARRKSKKNIDFTTFPACGNQLCLEEQNRLWNWGYNRKDSVNLTASQILTIDQVISDESKKHLSLEHLAGLIAWGTLPFINRIKMEINSQFLNAKHTFHPPFRILVLVDPSANSYLVEWVRTKFNFLGFNNLNVPLKSEVTIKSQTGNTHVVVIEEIPFLHSLKIRDYFASLIILVCNEDFVDNVSSHDRVALLKLIKSEESTFENGRWKLNKQSIDNPSTSKRLLNFVYSCWKERSSFVKIQRSSLHTLVEKFITKKILDAVFQIGSKLLQCKEPFLAPEAFILFFNDGISHIISCLEKSKDFIYFTSDIWTSEKIKEAGSLVKKAALPIGQLSNWFTSQDLNKCLTNFCNLVADPNDWTGHFFSGINTAIKRSQPGDEEGKENNQLESGFKVPWLDILSHCILYKLSFIPDIEVFYSERILEEYDNDPWIAHINQSHFQTLQKLTTRHKEAQKRKASELASASPQPTPKQLKKFPSQLLLDLEKEKQQFLLMQQQYSSSDEIDEELAHLMKKYHVPFTT